MGRAQTWLSCAPFLGKQPWGSLAVPLPPHPPLPQCYSCHAGTSPVVACSVALILFHVPAGLACDVCALPAPSSVTGTTSPALPEEGFPALQGQDPPALFYNVLTLLFGVTSCLVPTVFQPLSYRTLNKIYPIY